MKNGRYEILMRMKKEEEMHLREGGIKLWWQEYEKKWKKEGK